MGKELYISKMLAGFLVLFAIILNSCENECETCRKYNLKTGIVTDEVTACDRDMIRDLESKGYDCR